MPDTKTYNGHANWSHWNVALWLFNDEPLYRRVMFHLRTAPTKDEAARRLCRELPDKTPDGASYSLKAVRAALSGYV